MSLVDMTFALYETEGTLLFPADSIQNVGMCLHTARVTVLTVLLLSLSLTFAHDHNLTTVNQSGLIKKKEFQY